MLNIVDSSGLITNGSSKKKEKKKVQCERAIIWWFFWRSITWWKCEHNLYQACTSCSHHIYMYILINSLAELLKVCKKTIVYFFKWDLHINKQQQKYNPNTGPDYHPLHTVREFMIF